jgi:hypothetical protein
MSQAARVIPFRRDRRPVGRLERLGRDLANLEQSQLDVVKEELARRRAERQEKQQTTRVQAAERLSGVYQNVLRDVRGAGLGPTETRTLEMLANCALLQDGPPSIEQLAEMLKIQPASAKAYVGKIKGRTCAGLGLDGEAVQRLAPWLRELLEGRKLA